VLWLKLYQEIQITPCGVETRAGGRTNEEQSPHRVLAAQIGDRGEVGGNEVDHAGSVVQIRSVGALSGRAAS